MLVEDVVCRLWPPNSKCGRESRADTGGQPSGVLVWRVRPGHKMALAGIMTLPKGV